MKPVLLTDDEIKWLVLKYKRMEHRLKRIDQEQEKECSNRAFNLAQYLPSLHRAAVLRGE